MKKTILLTVILTIIMSNFAVYGQKYTDFQMYTGTLYLCEEEQVIISDIKPFFESRGLPGEEVPLLNLKRMHLPMLPGMLYNPSGAKQTVEQCNTYFLDTKVWFIVAKAEGEIKVVFLQIWGDNI